MNKIKKENECIKDDAYIYADKFGDSELIGLAIALAAVVIGAFLCKTLF